MVISPVEDRPNAPHCGQKLRGRLALTLAVVKPGQCHSVLVGIVKPTAAEIILYVTLN